MKKQQLYIVLILVLSSCSKTLHQVKTEPQFYKIETAANIEADPSIEELIAPYKEQIDEKMNQVIGENVAELVKAKPESTLGNWEADLIHKKCEDYYGQKIDFAVVNYGGIRVPSLSKGAITNSHIFELMPFDNALVVLKVDGKTVQLFFDLMAANGGWPISHTVAYKIVAEQAKEITINGEAIDPDRIYKIGISDFVANGGDNCFFFRDQPRDHLKVLFRDAILEHVNELTANGKKIEATLDGRVVVE